jgi:hypothetical protein
MNTKRKDFYNQPFIFACGVVTIPCPNAIPNFPALNQLQLHGPQRHSDSLISLHPSHFPTPS